MITVEFFNYTEAQWNAVKAVIRDALNVDADQIAHQVTSTLGNYSATGMLSLRDRIELAVSKYRASSDATRQGPRRAKLVALRKKTENLRASIIDALAVQIAAKGDVAFPFTRPGVDDDMLTATDDYFRKLASNLNRQIERAGTSSDNRRQSKAVRDQCWDELLAIWCEIGGKRSGNDAAAFLDAASKPVMGNAVPDIQSIRRWLDRRRTRQAFVSSLRQTREI